MFCVIPIIWLFIPEPGTKAPGGVRVRPRGATAASPSAPAAALEGMTAAEVRRDRVFWLVVLVGVLGGGLSQGMQTHMVAAMVDKGFSTGVAGEAISFATLVGLVGTLAGGFALDHFRGARIMSVFALVSALGAVLFALVSASLGGLPLLTLALALYLGAANATVRPGGTYLQTRFFGLRAFGEAQAIQVVFSGIGMAATPPLFGMIFDRFGSYVPVYWIVVGGTLIAAGIYLVLGPYRYGTGGPPPGAEQAGSSGVGRAEALSSAPAPS